MPVISTNDFYIGLNFELSVDVTWNRFSSNVWVFLTGFGGSVRTAFANNSHFGQLLTKIFKVIIRIFVIKYVNWTDFIQVSSGRTLLWILMLLVPVCQASFLLQ